MKTLTLPELFDRWRNAAWPLLTRRPETPPEAALRKAEQLASNQEWEDEGGSTRKPAPSIRWGKAGWPVLSVKSETLLTATRRKVEQAAAKQKWDAEGGAIQPPIVPGPKLPL